MRRCNPKFVPREWLLVAAYTSAGSGDYGPAKELHALFERPFDENPLENYAGEGTPAGGWTAAAAAAKFYRRQPEELANLGGVKFMS